MTSRSRLGAGALLLSLALTAGATACSSRGAEVTTASSAAPVALAAKGAPPRILIGVVVSLTSEPGQGGDWSTSAEGAEVAAYRYRLGGVDVRIAAENDKGSGAGGRDAVRRLVDRHVSGIVLATEGRHVRPAIAQAQRSGVPVLLPYGAPASVPSGTAWSTGPGRGQVGETLARALASAGLKRPLLVHAGVDTLPDVSPAVTVRYRPGADPTVVARTVDRHVRAGDADAVVVSGPAQLQAELVAALQGLGSGVPLLLTPQALSPAFAGALGRAGASLDADLTTVGVRGGDATALEQGEAGRAASGYFAAVRAAAADSHVKDFFDGRPFARVAGAADSRSHDAVVALVTAAARAGSAEPADVGASLRRLRLTSADGLAGPDLDFRRRVAVGSSEVTALHATTQDPGVTPAGAPRIHWFASPTP